MTDRLTTNQQLNVNDPSPAERDGPDHASESGGQPSTRSYVSAYRTW